MSDVRCPFTRPPHRAHEAESGISEVSARRRPKLNYVTIVAEHFCGLRGTCVTRKHDTSSQETRFRSEAVLSFPVTLGALARSSYGGPDRALRSVKDEMRQNLL